MSTLSIRLKTIVAAAVIGVSLGGCVTTSTNNPGNDIENFIREVQGHAREICGYVPLGLDIVKLINNDIGNTAQSIASAICGAIGNTRAVSRSGVKSVRVRGVVVHVRRANRR